MRDDAWIKEGGPVSSEIGKIFKAVADATRRQILEVLRTGEQSAGAIAKKFEMTKPAISHHLAALKAAGLVSDRRKGQQIIYAIKEGSILAVWDEFLAKFCPERKGTSGRSKGATKRRR